MHLVFLHGLLGSQQDWQAVINLLKKTTKVQCIALDLPFHGDATHIEVSNFEDCSEFLAQQIQYAVKTAPYFLVGYSLGGRLALHYALQAQVEHGNLQGVILEGANLGLTSEVEKATRWENDCQWATRFALESAETVLNDWYKQPVFAHLNAQQRAALIRKRAPHCGENIGKMLKATSLAKQPYFGEKVRSNSLPIYYFAGEKDQKFKQMAQHHQLNLKLISNAGHNAHLENPLEFAKRLYDIQK